MAEVGEFFADTLRARWVTGLQRVTSPQSTGIEDWLRAGAYSWMPGSVTSARLDIGTSHDLIADAFAYDIGRFACAAYESLIDAVPTDGKGLGWSLVRHYYAMFYAAHALLRVAGVSVTMISPQTSARLNKVRKQYLGVSPLLSSGLHLVQLDQSNRREVTLTQLGGTGGGSHEEMWKQFLNLVLHSENQIVLSHGQSSEAQVSIRVLTLLRQHLCRHGKNNGAWASSVRNNINYKHSYGVWYPYSVTNRFVAQLSSRMSQWEPGHAGAYDIGLSTEDLSCMADTCNVMAQLLTSTLVDVSTRAPTARKSFVDRMPFKLLRLKKFDI